MSGVFDLRRIRYVLYEANGKLSVLREDPAPLTEVMRAGVRDAQGNVSLAPSMQA